MQRAIRTEREVEKQSRGYLLGVIVLSLSAIAVKFIGLFYKIPMLKLLGSEGMGYFNSAYELYALFCVISTSGIPIAMSVMISTSSKDKTVGAQVIFKIAARALLLIGIVCATAMFGLAYPFSKLLGEEKCVYALLTISPGLLFACLTGAYRGYFQGLSRMVPTAVSQLIETVCKLVFGLLFVYLAIVAGYSTEIVAAAAALGLVIGSAISMCYLFITRKTSKTISGEVDHIEKGILRMLFKMSAPITLSAAALSFTRLIDMAMIIRRLQSAGCTSEEAFSVYGGYTTLAVPLFALAPTLISSVAQPLIPRLGDAISSRNMKEQTTAVNDAIRLASIISMPISMGLSLFSKEILELLFRGQREEIESCAPLLSMLGISVVLSCMVTVGNSILHAYGHAKIPMIAMLIGSVVKIVTSYFLIGSASIGIAGAPISTFLCDFTINAINAYYISKCLPSEIAVGRTLVRPFVASALSVALVKIFYGICAARVGEGTMLTLSFIGLAALVYIPACLLLGVVKISDISIKEKKKPAQQGRIND